MKSIISPWLFFQWGVDILGYFPLTPGQLKFIIVGVNYFTKWVEVEAVATITTERVHQFCCKNIIYRFRLPKIIILDSETHFTNTIVLNFYTNLGIENNFTSVEHP